MQRRHANGSVQFSSVELCSVQSQWSVMCGREEKSVEKRRAEFNITYHNIAQHNRALQLSGGRAERSAECVSLDAARRGAGVGATRPTDKSDSSLPYIH